MATPGTVRGPGITLGVNRPGLASRRGDAVRWLRHSAGAPFGAAAPVGALIAYQLSPSRRVIAVVMALGTGLLIGPGRLEPIDEALETQTVFWVSFSVMVGAAVFTVGDWLLTRGGGGDRSGTPPAPRARSPLAVVLGSVLDGIPGVVRARPDRSSRAG